jgi:hypothetical protein
LFPASWPKDVSDDNLAIRRDAAGPVKTGVGEVARQSIAMHLRAHQQHLIRVRRSYRCDDVALLRQAQRLRPEVTYVINTAYASYVVPWSPLQPYATRSMPAALFTDAAVTPTPFAAIADTVVASVSIRHRRALHREPV